MPFASSDAIADSMMYRALYGKVEFVVSDNPAAVINSVNDEVEKWRDVPNRRKFGLSNFVHCADG